MGEPGYDPLHGAARRGSADDSPALPQSPGADVDARDDRGRSRTPLHLAAAEGHDDAVLLPLQAGARSDALGADEASLLDHAAAGGGAATVQLLLDHLRPPSAASFSSPAGCAARRRHKEVFTALIGELEARGVHWRDTNVAKRAVKKGSCDIVSALLARWPEAVRLALDDEGSTMLILAAKHRGATLVRLLLARGADLLQRNKKSGTALHCAAFRGSVPVIQELWAHTERSQGTRAGLLHLLARHPDAAALALGRPARLLRLWRGVGDKQSPLSVAVLPGHLEAVKLLVELLEPATPVELLTPTERHKEDETGRICKWSMWERQRRRLYSPFSRPRSQWPPEGLEALQKRSAVLSWLVERGVVRAVAMLPVAARRGHPGLVRTLLAGGADPLQRYGGSRTALDHAVLGGDPEVIDALWEHTNRSSAGREELQALWCPPLCLAATNNLLREAEQLVALGADVNRGRAHATYETPLYCAVLQGKVWVADRLLGWGARPRGPEGTDSALHAAARSGRLECVKLFLPDSPQGEARRREQLAVLQHVGKSGRTALHHAVENTPTVDDEVEEVVEHLLKREVQLLEQHYDRAVRAGGPTWREAFTVYRRDAEGRTPLQSCFGWGVMRALLLHMEDERVMALGGTDVRAVQCMVREAREQVRRREVREAKKGWRGLVRKAREWGTRGRELELAELDASLERLQRRL